MEPSIYFEHHPNPMLVFDTDTLEILEVNEKAIETYGFTREEFCSLTIEDIRPPEDISKLREVLNSPELKEGKKLIELGEFKHKTKNGKILHVKISTQKIPSKNRNARLVHILDITDLINLKKSIEATRKNYQEHLDNNPLAMVKYDREFRVIEWSKRAAEKTGYRKSEILGISLECLDLFIDDEKERVLKIFSGLVNGSEKKSRFETILRKKDGTTMQVKLHASVMRDTKGELESVLAFIENINGQKNYEKQLIIREMKYHRLFESANDSIFLMNGMKIIDCNGKASEMLKADKKEIIGSNPLVCSPEIQPNGEPSIEKATRKINKVKNGEPQVFEWRHINNEGEVLDVNVSLNQVTIGEESFIQAVVRDLTEEKKAQKSLKEERARLRDAQELASLGWFNYDVINDQGVWSDIMYKIIGLAPDNFAPAMDSFMELVHPDDMEKTMALFEKIKKIKQPHEAYLRLFNKKKGKYIFTRYRLKGKYSKEGELVYINGFTQDVTSQKELEQELRHREQLFESLFLYSPNSIVMFDLNWEVVSVNKKFEELFGFSKKELVGRNFLKRIVTEESYEESKLMYNKLLNDKGSASFHEDTCITKEGEAKTLLVSLFPVWVDGKHIVSFGIYTDITQLKQIEENLEDSLHEKEILLSEIHHRVKNNLAIVSGLLELESMNFEQGSDVSRALKQSQLRIHSIARIHELLYKSKDFATVDLGSYVKDLVKTIYNSMTLNNENIKINVNYDEVSLNINQALPCALMINELVTNSLKYSFENREEGKIDIEFLSNNGEVYIKVKDDGVGLPVDFDELATRSLGHNIVKQLATQINAELNAESCNSMGTQYNIRFKKQAKAGSGSSYFK